MHALLIEPHLTDNGAIRVSLDRARRWRRQGAEVTVLVLSHDIAPHDHAVVAPPDLPVTFASAAPLRLRHAIPVGLLQSLRLARRADVVVAGREIDTGLLMAAAAARLLRRPLAVTVQSNVAQAIDSYVPPRLRRPTLAALRGADLAVCVASGLVPGMAALGLDRDRIAVVRNGVDTGAIRDRSRRAPSSPLPDGPVVASSGRLTRQKGFDLLIRAHAEIVAGGGPAHTLLILGEGPERPALEHLAAELGVGDSVRMPGFDAEPHATIARADLAVFPSRWEGFPLGVVEALCVGTPLVVADCVSGPSEILRDGLHGRLVPVEDVSALAAAIAAHLTDPGDLRTRAAAGAADVAQCLDPDRAAQQHLDLLENLVASRRRHST